MPQTPDREQRSDTLSPAAALDQLTTDRRSFLRFSAFATAGVFGGALAAPERADAQAAPQPTATEALQTVLPDHFTEWQLDTVRSAAAPQQIQKRSIDQLYSEENRARHRELSSLMETNPEAAQHIRQLRAEATREGRVAPAENPTFVEIELDLSAVTKGGVLAARDNEYQAFFLDNSALPDSQGGPWKNWFGVLSFAAVPENFTYKGAAITTAFTYEGGIILVEGNLEDGTAKGHYLRLEESEAAFDYVHLMPNGDIYFGDSYLEGMFYYNGQDETLTPIKAELDPYRDTLTHLEWLTPYQDGMVGMYGTNLVFVRGTELRVWSAPVRNSYGQEDVVQVLSQGVTSPEATSGDTLTAIIYEKRGNNVQNWRNRVVNLAITEDGLTATYAIDDDFEASELPKPELLRLDSLEHISIDTSGATPVLVLADTVSYLARLVQTDSGYEITDDQIAMMYSVPGISEQMRLTGLSIDADGQLWVCGGNSGQPFAVKPQPWELPTWQVNAVATHAGSETDTASNGYPKTIFVGNDGRIYVGFQPLDRQFNNSAVTILVPILKTYLPYTVAETAPEEPPTDPSQPR